MGKESNVKENSPIYTFRNEIKESISQNPVTIIVGETGSWKSTLLPSFALEATGGRGKVAVTQPRRIAARSIAKRIAELEGCEIGEKVGYQVRFDDQTGPDTQINVMTDGLLLRQAQTDPLLSEYSVIMIDEAHERSENIDVTIGRIKQIQKEREGTDNPLTVIIASATMEQEKLSRYFDDAPIIEVPGRQFPIELHYEKEMPEDVIKAAAERVHSLLDQDKEGDMLIFMPGKTEIEKTIREINRLGEIDADVLPFFADMSAEEQDKVLAETGKRKIIVSTNIAETSLNLPKLRIVIDSGLIKEKGFDPIRGIDTLPVIEHAQSGCNQRGGRAGRFAPGECHRLYTKQSFERRPKFQTPEILRSNLNATSLRLSEAGTTEIESFPFIDYPTRRTIDRARSTLQTLGALDEEGSLTEVGQTLSELPLEPHVAKMLLEADNNNCVEAVATVAAFIEGKNIFLRPKDHEIEADKRHDAFKVKGSDFMTLLNIWRLYEKNEHDENWAAQNYFNGDVLKEVTDIREQLFDILLKNNITISDSYDATDIGKSVTAGLMHNLLVKSKGTSYRLSGDGTRTSVAVHPSSALKYHEPNHMVAAEVVETTDVYARTCQTVEPDWLTDAQAFPGKRRAGKKERRQKKKEGAVELYSR